MNHPQLTHLVVFLMTQHPGLSRASMTEATMKGLIHEWFTFAKARLSAPDVTLEECVDIRDAAFALGPDDKEYRQHLAVILTPPEVREFVDTIHEQCWEALNGRGGLGVEEVSRKIHALIPTLAPWDREQTLRLIKELVRKFVRRFTR